MKLTKNQLKELVRKSIYDTISEDDSDKYTHIAYGIYKKKGQEKNKLAPTFKKDDSGKFIPVEKDGDKEEKPEKETKPPMKIDKNPMDKEDDEEKDTGGKPEDEKDDDNEKEESTEKAKDALSWFKRTIGSRKDMSKIINSDELWSDYKSKFEKAAKATEDALSILDPDAEINPEFESVHESKLKKAVKKILTPGSDQATRDVLGQWNKSTWQVKYDKDGKKIPDYYEDDYKDPKTGKPPNYHESKQKRHTVKEIRKWMKTLEENRYKRVYNSDARRVAWMANNMNEDVANMPKSMSKKWTKAQYGRERYLAKEFLKSKQEQMTEQKLRKMIRGILKEGIGSLQLKTFKVFIKGYKKPFRVAALDSKDAKRVAHQMMKNNKVKIQKVVQEGKLTEAKFKKIILPNNKKSQTITSKIIRKMNLRYQKDYNMLAHGSGPLKAKGGNQVIMILPKHYNKFIELATKNKLNPRG